ncbi:hypothetical protein [Algoriphagus aquimarinus]|nr:hypothetical protein [Algoriphagus aquimarinus]
MNFIFPAMIYHMPLKIGSRIFLTLGFSLKQLQKNLIKNPT